MMNFDVSEELRDKINSVSDSTGISKTTLLTFGLIFIIFLANSNTLPQVQSFALVKGVSLEQAFQQFLNQISLKGTQFAKDIDDKGVK